MKHHALLSFVMAVGTSTTLVAQPADSTHVNILDKTISIAESVLDLLTVERDSWSFAIYPAASYSGRTGLAVGVMPMFQFRNPAMPHPTTLTPSALVSTKGMFELQCDADIYLPNNLTILSKAEFYYQPDEFYAIGNSTKTHGLFDYNYYRGLFTTDILVGLNSDFQLGLTTDITYHHFAQLSTDSTALQSMLLSTDGWSNGTGIVLSYDTRDNVLNARNGWYVRTRAVFYGRYVGSRRNFTVYSIDVRRYWPVGDEAVLATQLYIGGSNGLTPFYKMPTCGGTRLGRAIPHNLKYVDRYAWLAQAEYRFPVYWRIGATAWTALGDVSHNISAALSNIHAMAGVGLRFKVFPEHGLNLRLDAGVSSRGDNAIYFNIREAF